MKKEEVKFFNKNKKISVIIINLLDKSKFLNNREIFFKKLLDDIKRDNEKGHLAGFLDENSLRNQLESHVYDRKRIKISLGLYQNIKIKEIKNLTKKAIIDVMPYLNSKKILIYVFPTCSRFIIKNMRGCGGFLAWKNIMHIYLYPTKDWKDNFKSTLLHELAHSTQPYYSYDMNIFEHLIAEGLAENFQMQFTKKRNPWTYSISKKDAIKTFKLILNSLDKNMKEDFSLHTDLFFGNKKYPLWAGYTIGFYLVEDIIKEEKKINWKKILKTNPSKFKNHLKSWFN